MPIPKEFNEKFDGNKIARSKDNLTFGTYEKIIWYSVRVKGNKRSHEWYVFCDYYNLKKIVCYGYGRLYLILV